MVLSDFLLRQNHNYSNPHKKIPISFNMLKLLHEKYYNRENREILGADTISNKSCGIRLLEVHGMRKNLNHNLLPIKQHTKPIKGNEIFAEKPQIGQERAVMGRKRPSLITQTIIQPSELSQKIPGAAKIEMRITNSANSTSPAHSLNNANEGMTQRRPLTTDVPFYPSPTTGLHPNPLDTLQK